MHKRLENQINDLGGEIKFTNTETNPAEAMLKGAKPIETDGRKGIVIEDIKGNQWTWVEVPRTIFINADKVDKNAEKKVLYDAINIDLINYVTTPTDYRNNNYFDEYYEGCRVKAKDEKTVYHIIIYIVVKHKH